jgi:hypothetical protein
MQANAYGITVITKSKVKSIARETSKSLLSIGKNFIYCFGQILNDLRVRWKIALFESFWAIARLH